MNSNPNTSANQDELKLGLVQLCSTDSTEANLQQILSILNTPEAQSCELLLFPENALFMRLSSSDKMQALSLDNKAFTQLEDFASKHNCVLHLGSTAMQSGEHVLNASLLIEPNKKTKISYKKIHMFDIQLKTGLRVCESDVFYAGDTTEIFQLKNWKIGQSICYDLRFSNLFLKYAEQEVDMILVPAAFLVPTGQAHWHTLLKARAIESQVYIAAAAQAGWHGKERHSFGHSLLVEPWGEVIIDGSEKNAPVLYTQTVYKSKIHEVRAQIPMTKHRRKL